MALFIKIFMKTMLYTLYFLLSTKLRTVKKAYIGLGSNLGDRAANLLCGVAGIIRHGMGLIACSSIYETEPVENIDQPSFLNLAVAVEGPGLEPYALMKLLLEVENEMGRVRTIDKGARKIDLDLLMLDDEVIDGSQGCVNLTLPHPRMHLRRFVLVPLAEIASDVRHPLMGMTISQLLADLDDDSSVIIYRQ